MVLETPTLLMTDVPEPMRTMLRSDRHEPKWENLKTEQEEPSLAKLRTLKELPTAISVITERRKTEPTAQCPMALIDDPMRTKLLSERAEPMKILSSIEVLSETLSIARTLTEDPKHNCERTEHLP